MFIIIIITITIMITITIVIIIIIIFYYHYSYYYSPSGIIPSFTAHLRRHFDQTQSFKSVQISANGRMQL